MNYETMQELYDEIRLIKLLDKQLRADKYRALTETIAVVSLLAVIAMAMIIGYVR